ncbi:hypothetical protein, partial [Escherichia coli]
ISGRSARGKRIHTRAIHSIDTDIKLNVTGSFKPSGLFPPALQK